MEEHRADTDAERDGTPRDEGRDLDDRLGRLERVVAGMAAEAAGRGGDAVAAEPEPDREPVDPAPVAAEEAGTPASSDDAPAPRVDAPASRDLTASPGDTPEHDGGTAPADDTPGLPDGAAPPEDGARRNRTRRTRWILAGSGVCCAVVLGAAVIGGGSAPRWLPVPGVAENGADPVNPTPPPAGSLPGSGTAEPDGRGGPGPGGTARSG